ncbi:chemotaxis signal transduction protein [Oxalobacteraceae bacterium GrIS 1.11]
MPSEPSTAVLLCRSQHRLRALPLLQVRESMRALPVEALPDMPPFMLGLAVIRGAALPVLDLVLPDATAAGKCWNASRPIRNWP